MLDKPDTSPAALASPPGRSVAFWQGWSLGLAVVAALELGEAAVWLAAGSVAWRPLGVALAAGLAALAAGLRAARIARQR